VFKSGVIEDLSHTTDRLKGADEILERQLRRLVKGFIREKHTPKKSDVRPVGELLGQTIRGVLAARRGDVDEAERSAEALNRLFPDPHYRQRNQLNEALNIAEKIQIDYLLDFHQATKTSDLVLILPGWKRMIQPRPARARILSTS
jgi:hypothetical protein